MGKFTRYFENGFSGCTPLAKTYDNCRKREVTVFLIPGEVEVVGCFDQTDAWIAPVSADPFTVNIQRLVQDFYAGKFTGLVVDPPKPARRTLKRAEESPPPPQRRRLNPPPSVPQTSQRRRLHVQ